MPRLPRIQIKGVLYYITCRGDHHEQIFKDEGDYQMFLGLLKKYKEQYDFKLFAYALLPSHLHLLMELSEASISDIMHDLNSGYTKYYNNKYERGGHLFRERFRAALVEKEPYLSKLTVYIHRNPQKLGLGTNCDYPYTSYCLYINKGKENAASGLTLDKEIEEVLGFLNGEGYLELVARISDDETQELHKNLHRGQILGSEEFVQKIKQEIAKSKAQAPAGSGAKTESFKRSAYVLGIILAGAGVFYFLRFALKDTHRQEVIKKEINTPENFKDLDTTEWDIRLIPVSGGLEAIDTLKFNSGKFISSKLYDQHYLASNYTLTIQDAGKIVWETMQTGPGATASWHGEVENGAMRGILSLRQDGKSPQDFSFMSIGYRRKE
jgi:REP element-mobilizing transposase RayT